MIENYARHNAKLFGIIFNLYFPAAGGPPLVNVLVLGILFLLLYVISLRSLPLFVLTSTLYHVPIVSVKAKTESMWTWAWAEQCWTMGFASQDKPTEINKKGKDLAMVIIYSKRYYCINCWDSISLSICRLCNWNQQIN